jgi:hypothetical protein
MKAPNLPRQLWITVEPAQHEDYGYMVRLPLDEWDELLPLLDNPYYNETIEDYRDIVDDLYDNIGVHVDQFQLVEFFQAVAKLTEE